MSAAPDADAALDPSTRANLEAILAVARELPSAEDAGVGGRNAAVLGQIAELAADIERVLDVADGFERLEAPPPPPRIAVLCGSTTDGGAADGTGAGYEGTLGDVDPDFEPILRAALPDGAVLVPYEEAIAAGDCVGALTVTHAHVSDALLEKLGPKLRVVSNYGVGVNHVDLEACARRGVKVGHTPGVLADATADLAWALLLACARRVPECDAYARSPAFVAYDNMAFLGCDVAGKTLGVVGMGSIGGEVARRALGFKMETLYFNRTRRPEAVERELKATWVPRLADLLPRCDFVVVVCPLTPATAGLLGAATLPLMRDGSSGRRTAARDNGRAARWPSSRRRTSPWASRARPRPLL
ncbi:hydroxypyruvate reductase [Aureococcus anophagefferens]|nr:hydroxypyruvate reductase [Aureococcus anophagefferens]